MLLYFNVVADGVTPRNIPVLHCAAAYLFPLRTWDGSGNKFTGEDDKISMLDEKLVLRIRYGCNGKQLTD